MRDLAVAAAALLLLGGCGPSQPAKPAGRAASSLPFFVRGSYGRDGSCQVQLCLFQSPTQTMAFSPRAASAERAAGVASA